MSKGKEAKRTSLYEVHQELGARIVPFAGFEMPILYRSIKEEHLAVRRAVGLFDVSHMGEVEFRGPEALANVQRLTCNDASTLEIGQVQYSALLYPEGTFVDDLLVYRLEEERYMLCVNASNTDKDVAWIRRNLQGQVEVEDRSDQLAQIAIQGPRTRPILQALTEVDLYEIGYYRSVYGEVCGHQALISRTGYTGEMGFEVYVDPKHAPEIWRALMEEGKEKEIQPVGLGARDTLRLEAGMHLYGNDIDHTTTPLEAGLDWIVKFDKGDFLGRDVLRDQRTLGVKRKLVGFRMVGRGIARQGYPVLRGGEPVGQVTSGTMAPFLGQAIGLAYVPVELAKTGQQLEIEIRGKGIEAEVIPFPFYSKKKKRKKPKNTDES